MTQPRAIRRFRAQLVVCQRRTDAIAAFDPHSMRWSSNRGSSIGGIGQPTPRMSAGFDGPSPRRRCRRSSGTRADASPEAPPRSAAPEPGGVPGTLPLQPDRRLVYVTSSVATAGGAERAGRRRAPKGPAPASRAHADACVDPDGGTAAGRRAASLPGRGAAAIAVDRLEGLASVARSTKPWRPDRGPDPPAARHRSPARRDRRCHRDRGAP